MKYLVLSALVALSAGAASAAVVTYDFETDQSASFTKVEDGGPDSTVEYQYDYSAYAGSPVPDQAPSGTGSHGVRVRVNQSLAAENEVTLYPALTGLDLSDGDWEMTFDVFYQYGTAGSTETFGFGAEDSDTQSGFYTGTNGFLFAMAGDGGDTADYRYAENTSGALVGTNAAPNWWGANETSAAGAGWVAFFPGAAGPPAIPAGAPGRQWVTIKLRVSDAGATRTVSLKKVGDSGFAQAGAVTGGIGSTLRPFVLHADFYTSVGLPDEDSWALFDNISIDDSPAPITAVADWNFY